MKRPAHGFKRDDRAIAALEFALVAPVLIIIFAAMVDIGNAIYAWSRLEAALAVGVGYTLTHTSSVQSGTGAALASSLATVLTTINTGAVTNATVVVNNGPTVTVTSGTSVASGTAGNANSCYCPTGAPPTWVWGSAAGCGSTCASSTSKAGKFVTISLSYNFTPLFSSYGFVQNGLITAATAVQAQ